MHATNFQQLLTEMANNRKQRSETIRQLQQSTFSFKTGLLNVKSKIEDAAERFSEIINPELHHPRPEAKILLLQRRAS